MKKLINSVIAVSFLILSNQVFAEGKPHSSNVEKIINSMPKDPKARNNIQKLLESLPNKLDDLSDLEIEKLKKESPRSFGDFTVDMQTVTAQNNQDSQSESKAVGDPDLKLSVDELRKKYSISWIDKEYGKNIFCDGDYVSGYCECDLSPEECNKFCPDVPTKPKNLACGFYSDDSYKKTSNYFRSRMGNGVAKETKRITFTEFTEGEIKSVLVNYDDNNDHLRSGEISDIDWRRKDVISIFIKYFVDKEPGDLTEYEEKILRFAFDPKIRDLYRVGCYDAMRYFGVKCGLYSMTSSSGIERRFEAENEQQIIKQKFQSLFSSKFNINLN